MEKREFPEHLRQVADLLSAGLDPVLLYEIKLCGAEGWSDPETIDDLLDPDADYHFLLY